MDVIAVNKHILGIQQLTPTGSKQVDTNGNGLIEADDSLLILKWSWASATELIRYMDPV